jgi:hypothetical protein
MKSTEKTGITLGIIGGLGLGLLLGREFSYSNITTIIGAILIVISFLCIGFLSFKENK